MAKNKAKFRYLTLPAALLASEILSYAEKLILADIKSYPFAYNLTYMSIARKFHLSRSNVMRSIERLSGELALITCNGSTKNRGLEITEKGLRFWEEMPKIKTKEPTPKQAAAEPVNSEAVRLASLFLDLIIERKPDYRRPDLTKWAGEIDRMIRIDKRTPERIEAVLRWSQKDSFWQTNILSPVKLRQHFDKLEMKKQKIGPTKELINVGTTENYGRGAGYNIR